MNAKAKAQMILGVFVVAGFLGACGVLWTAASGTARSYGPEGKAQATIMLRETAVPTAVPVPTANPEVVAAWDDAEIRVANTWRVVAVGVVAALGGAAILGALALGVRWAVPVEVIDFGWRSQADYLESLGARVRLRRDASGSPIRTDQNNLILDSNFGPITDPAALAVRIKGRAGIVEHGLFLSLASEVIVGCSNGVRRLTK